MNTPITDRLNKDGKAHYMALETARSLEQIAGELAEALGVCQSQTSSLRTWNGMGWSYHPPQAKRIHDTAQNALAKWQAMKGKA